MLLTDRQGILEQIRQIRSKLEELYSHYPKGELEHEVIYVPVPTETPLSRLNRISPYAPAIEESQWPRVKKVKSPYEDDYDDYEEEYEEYEEEHIEEECEEEYEEEYEENYYEEYEKDYEDGEKEDENYEGKLMKHLFSIDLRTIPKIKERFEDHIHTLSFFISSLLYNNAYFPGNGETCVMLHPITEGEFLPEELKGDEEIQELKPIYFDFVELEIPSVTFWSSEDWDSIDLEEYNPKSSREHKLIVDTYHFKRENPIEKWREFPLEALRSKLFELPAYVGGSPIWLQREEHWGFFIMQFSEAFVNVNLGDLGEMYVFFDTAFWQCY